MHATELILIRHGPTEWGPGRRLQGRADIPLSAPGREAVRHWRLPAEVDTYTWLSSPLVRATETARLLGGSPAVDDRLIEADWGEWEGRTLDDLRREMPDELAANEAHGIDFRPPGGESPRQVQDRVMSLLAELAARGTPTVAITHKGVIRAVYALAVGWHMTSKPPDRLQDEAMHRFLLAPDGAPAVDQLNIPLIP